RDQPESSVERCNIIQQPARRHLRSSFYKFIHQVRSNEQREKIQCTSKLGALPQMKGDGDPPRVLNQIIEMMFPFPAFGSFNFDARELSIQSIDDTESDGSEDSQPDAAKRKRCSRNATDDESCNRNLVGRDSRFAKERDYRRFNWRVDMSGKIQGAFLRRIQNDALSKTMVLCPRRRKTE